MGTRVTNAGLVVQLHDANGELAGDPLFGKFAHIQGVPRAEVLKSTGDLKGDEAKHPGSQHWLTLVAVADSCDRLNKILNDVKTQDGECFTSCSSRRVCVELHIGDKRHSFKNAVTIASGPVVNPGPEHPDVHVLHVRVLPNGAKMNKDLTAEFDGGSQAVVFE